MTDDSLVPALQTFVLATPIGLGGWGRSKIFGRFPEVPASVPIDKKLRCGYFSRNNDTVGFDWLACVCENEVVKACASPNNWFV